MTVTIGTDPELFAKQNETWVSAHEFLPGTKAEPYLVRGGAVQVDGVAVEFNTFPVETPGDFIEVIGVVLNEVQRLIPEDVSLHAVPTAMFDPEYFESLPLSAKALGCEPDYNAYTGEINEPPKTSEPFRTGAGHIHLGFTEVNDVLDPAHFERCCSIVRQLDTVLYPASMLWDGDVNRRRLYGDKGAFRPKPYGLEYRVLSNAFLNDQELIWWIAGATFHAFNLLEEGVYLPDSDFNPTVPMDLRYYGFEPCDLSLRIKRRA